jgi:hypothetical protein
MSTPWRMSPCPSLPVIEVTPEGVATSKQDAAPAPAKAPKGAPFGKKMQGWVKRIGRRVGTLDGRLLRGGDHAGIAELRGCFVRVTDELAKAARLFEAQVDEDGNVLAPPAIPLDYRLPKAAGTNGGSALAGAKRAQKAASFVLGTKVEIRSAKRELHADACNVASPLTVAKAPKPEAKSVVCEDSDGVRVSLPLDHLLPAGAEGAREAKRAERKAKAAARTAK